MDLIPMPAALLSCLLLAQGNWCSFSFKKFITILKKMRYDSGQKQACLHKWDCTESIPPRFF